MPSIEDTIRQLMEDSKKLGTEINEGSNPATKNAVAAEPMNKLDDKSPWSDGSGNVSAEGKNTLNGADQSERENEDNKRNNVDTQKEAEGGTSKKSNPANKNAVAPEAKNKLKGVKEDVEALFDGEEGLTEDFRTKAETIFEAAVISRVQSEVERIEEEYQTQLEEKFVEVTEGLVEHVDGYLNLMVEQWMNDNEVALVSGMKNEILENFISGLKNLFVESYIEVPEDKLDVIEAMEDQIQELTDAIDEATQVNIDLNTRLTGVTKKDVIAESCEGLSDLEADKLKNLAEELVFEDRESFATKLQIVRENFVVKKSKSNYAPTFINEDVVPENKEITGTMTKYVDAISKTTK